MIRSDYCSIDHVHAGIPLDESDEVFRIAPNTPVTTQRRYRRNTLFHWRYSSGKCRDCAPVRAIHTSPPQIGSVVACGSTTDDPRSCSGALKSWKGSGDIRLWVQCAESLLAADAHSRLRPIVCEAAAAFDDAISHPVMFAGLNSLVRSMADMAGG